MEEQLASPPSWVDLGTLLAGGFALVILLPSASTAIRRRVIRWSLHGEGLRHWIGERLEHNLGTLFAASLLLTFVSAVLLVILTLGRDSMLEAVTIGTGLAVFVGFQAPRLQPPAIEIAASVSQDKKSPGVVTKSLQLVAGQRYLIHFFVANAGTEHYTNCSCWIWFESDFDVESDSAAYSDVEFTKAFTLQSGDNCLCFGSGAQDQDMSPGNRLAFPAIVTPKKPGKFKARLEITSESRWGPKNTHLCIEVAANHQ